jgi:hypothetical protein
MKIDTDEWIALADACRDAGVPQSSGYRTAHRLGIIELFFGMKIIRKSDIRRLVEERLPVGNKDWIESQELAAQAALKATASRQRRVAAHGPSPAERRRNKFLASGKARAGDTLTPPAAKR